MNVLDTKKVMPIIKFYIKGNGKVIDSGLRLALATLAPKHNLRIYCRNLVDQNSVEVVVDGRENDVSNFYEELKTYDVRIFRKEGAYTLTPIEPYNGPTPDWNEFRNAFNTEQLAKGAELLQKVIESLESLPKRIAEELKK